MQLILSGFLAYAWSTLTNFVTNIEQNKNLFLKLWHHDFHSKITLKIFEVCCNSLIDDNMWCSIKNLCPAEVPSSSSRLLWGPKNLHTTFSRKKVPPFSNQSNLERCYLCSKDNALTRFKRDFEGSRKRRFIQLEHGMRTPDKSFFNHIPNFFVLSSQILFEGRFHPLSMIM